jgi:hypothetical protein
MPEGIAGAVIGPISASNSVCRFFHGSWPCAQADTGAFWLRIRFLEASWFDGQAALICLFTTGAFRHGSASAWHGWAR